MKMTASEIAAEVGMLRNTFKGAILLVEGYTDTILFEKLLSGFELKILPSFGWQNVADALGLLKKRAIKKIFGIIDLDYLSILNRLPEHDNLFTTDFHDIEIMMIETNSFQHVLKELASQNKIIKYPKGLEGIKERCYQVSGKIGALRFFSLLRETGYDFSEMDFSKFIDRKTLEFNVNKFLNHLRWKSEKNKNLTEDIFKSAVKETSYFSELNHHFLLCCGHDFIEVLARGLKYLWANYSSNEATAKEIEKMFRLAYSYEDFVKTKLHRQIKEWINEKS